MNDKKQRALEVAFLSGIAYPRLFMIIMESAEKLGMTETCFQSNDTRSAWMAVHALYKNKRDDWKRSSDDIVIRMAIEETVDRKELEASKSGNPGLSSTNDLIATLICNQEKMGFKQALQKSLETTTECSDVQTAMMITRSNLAKWERGAIIRNSSIDIAEVSKNLADRYTIAREKHERGEKVEPNGLQSPWSCLNECYNGFKVGLNFIAARPSDGKTAYAINFSSAWKNKGVKHAFISLDMPQEESVKRFGCYETELSDRFLAMGKGTIEQIERHRNAINSYKEHVFLYDSPYLSSIEQSIREAYYNGAQAIILDYLQLVRVKGCKNKWESITEAVASFEDLSKRELKIPFFILAQLNRQGVREGREPELHDIEGGGFIEQAAASVTTLSRDKDVVDLWKDNPPTNLCGGITALSGWLRPVWVKILKNQNGAIGEFPFVMYCPFFAFRPANIGATPNTAKGSCRNEPMFSEIHDDFRRFSFDD